MVERTYKVAVSLVDSWRPLDFCGYGFCVYWQSVGPF